MLHTMVTIYSNVAGTVPHIVHYNNFKLKLVFLLIDTMYCDNDTVTGLSNVTDVRDGVL